MNKKTEKHLAKLVAAKYKLDGSQSPRWHRTNDCMSMDKLHEVKEGQTRTSQRNEPARLSRLSHRNRRAPSAGRPIKKTSSAAAPAER